MKRDLRCLPKLKTLFPFSLHSVSLEWASLVSCKVPGVEFSSTTLLPRRGFVQRAAAGPSRQPGPSASSASCGLVTLSPFLHLCISGFSSLRGGFPGRMGGGEGGARIVWCNTRETPRGKPAPRSGTMFASSACLTSPAGGAAPEWQEPVASLGLPLASRQRLLWSCPRASGWGRLLICGEGTFCPVLLLSLGAGKVHGSCKAPESRPGEAASFSLSRLIVSVLDGVLSVTGPLRPHSKLNLRAAGPARWSARLPFETPDWGLKRQIYFLTVVEAGRP